MLFRSKVPIGFTARVDSPILVTPQQFFDLMKATDVLGNIIAYIKQQNIDNDNIRYYFEEDLIDAKDEKGSAINSSRMRLKMGIVRNRASASIPESVRIRSAQTSARSPRSIAAAEPNRSASP